MAETLTYDAATDTVTSAENLNADEQDSLKVGEELQSEQESLLAGKYKNAEELESAYMELQKKLGSDEEKAEETTTTDKEESGYEKFYNEDGSVDYGSVNENYGEKLGEIFKNSDIDPYTISKHFHENEGQITDDMYKQLTDAGLSKASVDSYLAGRAAEMGYTNQAETADLSDKEINTIQNSVGGEDDYNNLMSWANENLAKNQTDAFDSLVESGNSTAIELAVRGLKAQYEEANGYEGRMLSGKPPKASMETFRSQAELVEAMSDSRYEDDPAYRQDLIDKLNRSDLNF
tara:strand:+ start:2109 stop:2981 length:873 start_codon:yes stop_codon:yes gene_type:complete